MIFRNFEVFFANVVALSVLLAHILFGFTKNLNSKNHSRHLHTITLKQFKFQLFETKSFEMEKYYFKFPTAKAT